MYRNKIAKTLYRLYIDANMVQKIRRLRPQFPMLYCDERTQKMWNEMYFVIIYILHFSSYHMEGISLKTVFYVNWSLWIFSHLILDTYGSFQWLSFWIIYKFNVYFAALFMYFICICMFLIMYECIEFVCPTKK